MLGSSGSIGIGARIKYIAATSVGSLPSAAAENTFALITSTTIPANGVSIRSKVPSSGMVTGDVVILVGRDSAHAYEVALNSKIYAAPISAYQYTGSAWASIPAYVYQAAAWATIWIYYYNNGVYSIITGFASGGNGTFSTAGNVLTLSATNNLSESKYESIASNEAVDLTNYNTLKFKYSLDSTSTINVRVYVYPTQSLLTSASWPSMTAYAAISANGSGTASINVSALTGNYKVHAGLYTMATVNKYTTLIIQEIWAE